MDYNRDVQYVRETFLYLRRVWYKLGLLALPAAVLLGFLIKPVSVITYLPSYAAASQKLGFGDILRLVAGDATANTIFPPFLIFAVMLLTIGVMFSFIEKHFRIGRTLFQKSVVEINSYFLPALKTVVLVGGVMAVCYMLTISGVTLQHAIFSGERIGPHPGSVVVASLWSLILTAVAVLVCSPLIFMIPLMQIYGYSFGETFRMSLSYYGNNPIKITLGLVFGFAVTAAAGTAVAIIDVFVADWYWIRTLIYIALHLFLIVYVAAYCMVTTFSVTGMERKDEKKYGF